MILRQSTAYRRRCDRIKDELSLRSKDVYLHLREGDAANLTVAYVYLNVLQESREIISSLRKLLRSIGQAESAPRLLPQLHPPRSIGASTLLITGLRVPAYVAQSASPVYYYRYYEVSHRQRPQHKVNRGYVAQLTAVHIDGKGIPVLPMTTARGCLS